MEKLPAGKPKGQPVADQLGVELRDLFARVGQFLADVAEGIYNGVIAAGGVVFGAITDIIGGIVNFFKNLTAAVLGKGPSFLNPAQPDEFEAGPLADISDGQRSLIGKIEALEDNAGFCNLTMKKNWVINGNINKWLPMQFDTLVTENKNADPHGAEWTGTPLTTVHNLPGIMLRAPGVWHIQAHAAVYPEVATFQYFEVRIDVIRMIRFRDTPTSPWKESMFSEWSSSQFPGSTDDSFYASAPAFKPVLIPDLVVHTRFPNDEVSQEDVGYKVLVWCQFRSAPKWHIVGGTLWSSLSATRLSVDTTNYSPPSTGTGTGNIPDGAV